MKPQLWLVLAWFSALLGLAFIIFAIVNISNGKSPWLLLVAGAGLFAAAIGNFRKSSV